MFKCFGNDSPICKTSSLEILGIHHLKQQGGKTEYLFKQNVE